MRSLRSGGEGGSEQVWRCAGKLEVVPAARLKRQIHEAQEIAKVRGGGVGDGGAALLVRLCARKGVAGRGDRGGTSDDWILLEVSPAA